MADNTEPEVVVLDKEGKDVKERNAFERFIFTFINDDIKGVKEDVVKHYIVPGVIDLFRITAHGLIDNVFNKDIQYIGQSTYGRTASKYAQAYDKQNQQKVRNSSVTQNAYERYSNLSEITFQNRGKAEECLYLLKNEIARQDSVSVGFFFDIAGKVHTYADWDWGWTNLNTAYVKPVRGEYCIVLPKVVSLK